MAISYKTRFVDDLEVVSATGTTTVTGDITVDGKLVDSIELSHLDGLTGNIQAQIDGITTDTQTELALKANSADVYTKTAADTLLAAKADQATTYTKTETDSAIQAVVGAAPAALDTLKEIADQLANDESAVSALTTVVSTKANSADVYTKTAADTLLAAKQDSLVSGTNIKTINSTSVLGSGDITIPTGLSAWVTKTSAYTAVNKDRIMANTTSAAFTITLPASPTAGMEVTIADAAGTFGTNNLTVGRNSTNIMGSAQDLVLDVSTETVNLVYFDATRGWVLTK